MAILQNTWMVEWAVACEVRPSHSCGIDGSKSWKLNFGQIFVAVKFCNFHTGLHSQSVKSSISLSLRFYVKLILEDAKVQKMPFLQF